jgi:NRAMP (natural resistance-associated macrophage protein)-like metal ion transporter
MYWISKSFHLLRRFRRRTWLFLAALGPGIITMVADNDAGGILTYSQTGAKYQFSFLWIFILLVPMAYYVQEMTVRLGAVTKRGNAEAIFDGFGPFWGWFSIFDLAVINWLTLVTEYIGMTEAMSLFGVPPVLTYLAVTAILMAVVVSGRYWTFEKITLFFCAFNLVYIPAALWAMEMPDSPSWGKVVSGFWGSGFPGLSQGVIFMIMANIGTTITPWQIFFQQSAVVDKGMDERDIKVGKIDTFFGSFLTGVVAMFIIVVTGAALYPQEFERVTDVAAALEPLLPEGKGQWAERLFAIGLFDAGFLGALCISLSTSWAVGEVFGWAHSLNKSVRDAPWFYVVYLGTLLTSGAIVLIPGAPLPTITMFVQVVAVTLLPAALLFLILLLNDRPLMGESVNTRWQNIANWGIAIFVIAISTLYGASVFLKEILDYDISSLVGQFFGTGG